MECSTEGIMKLMPIYITLFVLIIGIFGTLFGLLRYYESKNKEAEQKAADKVPAYEPFAQQGTQGEYEHVPTPRSKQRGFDQSDTVSKSTPGMGSGSGQNEESDQNALIEMAAAQNEEEEEEDGMDATCQNEGVVEGMGAGVGGAAEDEAEIELADGDAEGMMDSTEHLATIGKIVMGYLQVLTCVGVTLPSIDWPDDFISGLCQPFAFLNFDFSQLFPVGCLVQWDFYLDMQISFGLPIFVTTLALIWRFSRKAKLAKCNEVCCEDHAHVDDIIFEKQANDIDNNTCQICLTAVFIMYPMLVTKMMGVFVCREIESEWWLEADVTLQCYNDSWVPRAVLGFIGIICYCIGIPASFFYFLHKHKDELDHPDVVAKIGFLYTGYALHFWLGELVEMTRKMFMSGVIMFVAPDSVMQVIVAATFCACFLMMQVAVSPFEDEIENKVQMWCLMGTALTVLFGLLIVTSQGSCNSDQVGAELETISSCVLWINMFVLVMIVYYTCIFLKADFEFKRQMLLHMLGKKQTDEESEMSEMDQQVNNEKEARERLKAEETHDWMKTDDDEIEMELNELLSPAEIIRRSQEIHSLEYADEYNTTVVGAAVTVPHPMYLADDMKKSEDKSDDKSAEFDHLLQDAFNRYEVLSGIGQIIGAEDLTSVCLNLVMKLDWKVTVPVIEDKARNGMMADSGYTKTESMSFTQFAAFFKSEFTPNMLDEGVMDATEADISLPRSSIEVDDTMPCPTCRSPMGELRKAFVEAECCVCMESVDQILVSRCGHTLCKDCALALKDAATGPVRIIAADLPELEQLSDPLDAMLQNSFNRFDVNDIGTISTIDDLEGITLNVASKIVIEEGWVGFSPSIIDEKAPLAIQASATMTYNQFSEWFKNEIAAPFRKSVNKTHKAEQKDAKPTKSKKEEWF